MEIEYISPKDQDEKQMETEFRRMEQQNTLGCLLMGLFLLAGLFIFLTLLPFFLVILGYSIIFLSVYILYKAYLEAPVLNLIQKLKSRRR